MLKFLLVDDEAPARDRLRRLLQAHPDLQCVGEAGDGLSALSMIAELRPDVVFLDIQMPEVDGLTVAAAIPDDGPLVVFATAFDQHAVRAFDLAAVDYLLKPIDKVRLRESLERVRARLGAGSSAAQDARTVLQELAPTTGRMAVRCGAKFVVFDTERISAVVAQDHYAAIFVDGRELLSDDPLDRVMARLDGSRFVRVHRSAIINIGFVQELVQEGDRKYVAILSEPAGMRISISRDRLDEVKTKLGIG
jgi:two-component system, LytTR family, response regulator